MQVASKNYSGVAELALELLCRDDAGGSESGKEDEVESVEQHRPCFDDACPLLLEAGPFADSEEEAFLSALSSSSSQSSSLRGSEDGGSDERKVDSSDDGEEVVADDNRCVSGERVDKVDGHKRRRSKRLRPEGTDQADLSMYDACKWYPRPSATEAKKRILTTTEHHLHAARLFTITAQRQKCEKTSHKRPVKQNKESERRPQDKLPYFFDLLGREVLLPRFPVHPMRMHPLDIKEHLFPSACSPRTQAF